MVPVKLFETNLAYVQAMRQLDAEVATTPTLVAASFVSSLYFPATALGRFFAREPDGDTIVAELISRQTDVHTAGRTLARRELYESQAMRNLAALGQPHDQAADYHVFPSEIKTVLGSVLEMLVTQQAVQVAITAEVLPLVFQCKNSEVLVDIRANYPYQRIQGMLITEEPCTSAQFVAEFDRLWASPNTISDQTVVAALVTESLTDWVTTGTLRADRWPDMMHSR